LRGVGRYPVHRKSVKDDGLAMPDEWGVPLVVMGMLLAMLFMAALVQRYQAHQARVRSAVRRSRSRIDGISQYLTELTGVPLSRELRVALRGEILARYQHIRRLHPRYPDIVATIRSAEHALQGEGARPDRGVGPLEDDQAFRTIIAALDALTDVVQQVETVQPIPRDVRVIFCRELGERRAEVMARFHLVQSMRCESEGKMTGARGHLTTLLHILRERGPSTDFVRELYAEAEAALIALTDRHIGISPAAPDDAGDQAAVDQRRSA
jgi:hypothetical protein